MKEDGYAELVDPPSPDGTGQFVRQVVQERVIAAQPPRRIGRARLVTEPRRDLPCPVTEHRGALFPRREAHVGGEGGEGQGRRGEDEDSGEQRPRRARRERTLSAG